MSVMSVMSNAAMSNEVLLLHKHYHRAARQVQHDEDILMHGK
jgi:hypothetical protein